MAERDELLALIRKHGLDALPVASKDKLEIQVNVFARTLRNYAIAAAEALREGKLDRSREAGRSYDLAAALYAPGIIEALAAALIETESRDA